MIKNLDEAIRIMKATMLNNDTNTYFPYFFIVGAGISVPEIPSSKDIINHCKKKIKDIDSISYEEYEMASQAFINDPMKYYSSWIEYAYPNRIDRSNLFKQLNEKAKISSANLILAQILNSNKFANTVFTPNFDDKLKSALDLMGNKKSFSAENAMDNLVINNHTKDIQIIHLHGTYNFYDCANLESEINDIASQSDMMSSNRLLSTFLYDQAPIIVGYSGWENDVIMTCLQERLSRPTPLQYFWICYNQESYDNLPNWLKNSNSMIFVVPQADDDKGFESCEDDRDSFLNNNVKPQIIDATKFFKRIVSAFSIETPLIFLDPYSYYSKEISDTLPKNEDVLHLCHWAQRLKLLKNNETNFEKLLQEIEEYFNLKDYAKAQKTLSKINKLTLTKANIEFVCFTIIREFIEDEDIVSSFKDRMNFHLCALEFIDLNLKKLHNAKALLYILHLILYTKFNYDEKDKMLFLFNKVRNVAAKDKKLLEIELTSLGIISSFSSKEEKKKLLAEIISRCPNNTSNNHLKYLKFKALCNLSTIVDTSDEAIKLIAMAEKILNKLNDKELERELLKTKSSIIYEIDDKNVIMKWGADLFKEISLKSTIDQKPLQLEIASNLMYLNDDYINDICLSKDNFKSIIVNILSGYNVDTTSCSSMLDYVKCCLFICQTSNNNDEKYEYANNIYLLKGLFPHECPSYSNYLQRAIFNILFLPNTTVTDDIKCSILESLKNDNTTNKIFYHLLPYVIEGKNVEGIDRFSDDISTYNEQTELKHRAFELYTYNKISEAEEIYSNLCQSLFTYISDGSKTNLSFIVRRKENSGDYDFWDIIKSKRIPNEFDWMNVALYCLANNDTSNPEYTKAINRLENLTNEQIENIKSCWEDVSLVGEEESKLALSLIKNTEKQ